MNISRWKSVLRTTFINKNVRESDLYVHNSKNNENAFFQREIRRISFNPGTSYIQVTNLKTFTMPFGRMPAKETNIYIYIIIYYFHRLYRKIHSSTASEIFNESNNFHFNQLNQYFKQLFN